MKLTLILETNFLRLSRKQKKSIKALKFAVNAVDRNTTGMQFLTRFVHQLLLKYAFLRK